MMQHGNPGIPVVPPNSMMGIQMQPLMQAPQQPSMTAAVAAAPAVSQPSAAVAAKSRKSHAIQIIDPETGKSIDFSGGKGGDEQKPTASSTSEESRQNETKVTER